MQKLCCSLKVLTHMSGAARYCWDVKCTRLKLLWTGGLRWTFVSFIEKLAVLSAATSIWSSTSANCIGLHLWPASSCAECCLSGTNKTQVFQNQCCNNFSIQKVLAQMASYVKFASHWFNSEKCEIPGWLLECFVNRMHCATLSHPFS